MKRIGIYAGSFNPFHKGHYDIFMKAYRLFDKIYIARYGENLDNFDPEGLLTDWYGHKDLFEVITFTGLLVDLIHTKHPTALIRGLRNGADLQYEMNQLYWNEDLGIDIPTAYFICDRSLGHISSSAIREINKIQSGTIIKKEV